MSTLLRASGLALLVLLVAGAAAMLTLPAWGPTVAARMVPGLHVALADRPGRDRWQLERLRYDSEDVRIEADTVTLSYSVWPLALEGLSVALANVTLKRLPAENGPAQEAPRIPAIAVAELQLAVPPLGLTFNGFVESRDGPSLDVEGRWRLELPNVSGFATGQVEAAYVPGPAPPSGMMQLDTSFEMVGNSLLETPGIEVRARGALQFAGDPSGMIGEGGLRLAALSVSGAGLPQVGRIQLDGSLRYRIAANGELSFESDVPLTLSAGDPSANLTAHLRGTMAEVGRGDLDTLSAVAMVDGSVELPVDGSLVDVSVRNGRIERAQGWHVSTDALTLGGEQAGGWSWRTPLRLVLDEALAGTLALGETFRFDGAWNGGQPIGQGRLQLNEPLLQAARPWIGAMRGQGQISLALTEKGVSAWSDAPLLVVDGGTEVELRNLALRSDFSSLSFSADALSLRTADAVLPDLAAAGRLDALRSQPLLSASLAGAGLSVQLDAVPISALDQLEVPFALSIDAPLLATWLGGTWGYDLNAGQVSGRVLARTKGEGWSVGLDASLTGGSGYFDDYIGQDISGRLLVTNLLSADGWRAQAREVRIGATDLGVLVEDIRLNADIDPQLVQISGLRAALLGGSARVANVLDFDLADERAEFVMQLQNIDLAQLVALEGDDIVATGRLQGDLPVRVRGDAIEIERGRLVGAPPGGTVRLSPALSRAAAQPGIDFALRALENFRYTALEADVTYSANGDLLAAVALRGSNPDIESGRPIHYNVNISENVPTLLRALRLQEAVNERVEERVRGGGR